MKTAILGAGGAIGKAVASTLVERDQPIRVVGRSKNRLCETFSNLPVEIVATDVSTTDGCAQALDGADAAVYTLGLPYSKKAFASYPPMMRLCLDAARNAGVRSFILITNVYPYGIPQLKYVSEDHPREPAAVKGQHRKEQEDLVLQAHDPDGLHTLSLRLPDFYGPDVDQSIVNGIFEAAVAGRKAGVLGPIDTPHEYVFTPDVGPVVADLLDKPEAFGTAYNFGGAGVMSIREFGERVFAEAGQGEARFTVAQGVMLRILGLFNSTLRELIEMEYMLKTPVLLDDSKLRSVLPDMKKTSYEEGIRQTLQRFRKM